MAVTLTFLPPDNFNLAFYEIGQSISPTGAMNVVASGTDIGIFPNWVNHIPYSGDSSFYYSVRFGTSDGNYTAWSSRMYGLYGSNSYFIFNPPGSQWVYLVPPQTPEMSGVIPSWLSVNMEYTVTIDSSGLWGSGLNYMDTDYSFTFGSQLCPAWSTVDAVRLTTGPIFDHIPDDTINKMIYRASYQCMSIFFSSYNPYGCDYTSVPEPVFRWVTCMSGMLALNTVVARIGNISKKLGTFDVTYGMVPGSVTPKDLRQFLQDCINTSAIAIQAAAGTLLTFATKSIYNGALRHPQSDPQWGRHPRKVDMFVHGPWRRAYNDIKLHYSNYMLNPYDWGVQHMINSSNQRPGTIV